MLHPHQQRRRGPGAPHPHQTLGLPVFWTQVILIGSLLLSSAFSWWNRIWSIFAGCLPAICLSSWVRCPFRSLFHFKTWLLLCLLLSFKLSSYVWSTVLYQEAFCKYPLLGCRLCCHFADAARAEQKALTETKASVSAISLTDCVLGVYRKGPHHTRGALGFLPCYLLGVVQCLCFLFRSMLPTGWIFVEGVRSVSELIVVHVGVQSFHTIRARGCPRSIAWPLLLCSRWLLVLTWVHSWALRPVPFTQSSALSPAAHCSHDWGLVVILNVGQHQSSDVLLPFSIAWASVVFFHLSA